MNDNPFAGLDIRIPTEYHEGVKRFCRTSNTSASVEFAPFDRQVDFWFTAFVYAANKGLEPEQAKETTKIIEGSIFSGDAYRITLIQLTFFSMTNSLEGLTNSRGVLSFASEMANAGIPRLLQILDVEDDKPLFSLLEEIEAAI